MNTGFLLNTIFFVFFLLLDFHITFGKHTTHTRTHTHTQGLVSSFLLYRIPNSIYNNVLKKHTCNRMYYHIYIICTIFRTVTNRTKTSWPTSSRCSRARSCSCMPTCGCVLANTRWRPWIRSAKTQINV